MLIARLTPALVVIALLAALLLPAAAFAQDDPQAGTTTRTLIHDGLTRSYRLTIPGGYDGQTPLPLIIGLHGGTGTARQFARSSGLEALADELNFIAVIPNGTGRLQTWNAMHCCGAALRENVDDVNFIRALIETLSAELAVDPARIYAMGHSNGAMLAYRLGAELGDLLAAVGPVAGSVGGQADQDAPGVIVPAPVFPVSLIAIHGRQDDAVLYDGGLSGGVFGGTRVDVGVQDSIHFWRESTGCTGDPQISTSAGGNVVRTEYICPQAGHAITLITLEDGGHSWPGAQVSRPGVSPNQDINATRKIVDFFLAHPKVIAS